MNVTVTGAGGAIGGHLVKRLIDEGHFVTAVDEKPYHEWWQRHPEANNYRGDVSDETLARNICNGRDEVYNLACRMGGMGFILNNPLTCALSVRITATMLEAAVKCGVPRFFQSSSACVYRNDRQEVADLVPLTEDDAWPADPEPGYGLEKIYGEKLCEYAITEVGFNPRIARYHNVYGLHSTWTGGKEKAPAAICRKVAEAVISGRHEIEIWGDGEQTRSFMWMDDCIEGTLRLMRSDFTQPLNIGSSELVLINESVSIIEGIAGVQLERRYDLSAPQGVRGRSSDNTLCRKVLGWEPSTSLRDGLARLYPWVFDRVKESYSG